MPTLQDITVTIISSKATHPLWVAIKRIVSVPTPATAPDITVV